MNYLPFHVIYKNPTNRFPIPKEMDEIVEFCEKLADGLREVRVDCYLIDGKVYFGEMTFYTWGGFCRFEPNPEKWDTRLGNWINL